MSQFQILGSVDCPYCIQAKGLLLAKGILDYDWKELSDSEKADLKTKGYQTIPVIFKNGQHIGGKDELEVLLTGVQ